MQTLEAAKILSKKLSLRKSKCYEHSREEARATMLGLCTRRALWIFSLAVLDLLSSFIERLTLLASHISLVDKKQLPVQSCKDFRVEICETIERKVP